MRVKEIKFPRLSVYRIGSSLIPCLSVYRIGSSLIPYRFTGESTRSNQAAQQADRSWFLRGQQGKIKERQT